MPVPPKLTELVTNSSTTAPKTILGFVWGTLGLLLAAAVAVSIVLINNGELLFAAIVLAVPALTALLMLRTVLERAKTDPAGLMLGQVTGSEYARIRQVTQGDSSHGEIKAGLPVVVDDTEAEVLEPTRAEEIDAPTTEEPT